MADYNWNGAAGSYLDPAQWTPGDVPLYGDGDTATINAGTATLSDAEPNNLTLVLGVQPGTVEPSPILLLSNAALGPDLTLDAVGQATLEVDGYDTNYGQINVSALDSTQYPRGATLTVNIGAGSQLNQEGMISVVSTQTNGSTGVNLSFIGSGTLNNDGEIDFGPGSTALFHRQSIPVRRHRVRDDHGGPCQRAPVQRGQHADGGPARRHAQHPRVLGGDDQGLE